MTTFESILKDRQYPFQQKVAGLKADLLIRNLFRPYLIPFNPLARQGDFWAIQKGNFMWSRIVGHFSGGTGIG